MNQVLIDAGPLVSIFAPRDQHHAACVAQLQDLRAPLLTCWPVLTESAWLLRDSTASLSGLLKSFEEGLFQLVDVGQEALPWIDVFLRKYDSVKPQLADAVIMYLAEKLNISVVFTLDRHDFGVFRTRGAKALTLLPSM